MLGLRIRWSDPALRSSTQTAGPVRPPLQIYIGKSFNCHHNRPSGSPAAVSIPTSPASAASPAEAGIQYTAASIPTNANPDRSFTEITEFRASIVYSMPSITSKLPDTGTTIFTVMSALAAEYRAVNLGQGFPDFPMNEALIGSVEKAMRDGHNQYAHTNGHLPLRETIVEKTAYLYGTNVAPDTEITITPGGSYAISVALATVLRPGDEVIVFQPGYDSYIPNVLLNGATPVLINLQYPHYGIDWDAVRRAISPRTKMIMLNSPHNPTGAVLSARDIQELRTTVAGTGIFVLSDEVYEHIIFDDLPHQSMLRYPDLYERSFVCFSFGKIYHCTGWKIGYCIAPPELSREFRKIHQFNAFSVDSAKQVALASFLQQKQFYESLGKQLQQKRDHFLSLMKGSPFKMLPSAGSYFVLGSYGHFSDEAEKDFAARMVREYGVATIPVSAFYQDNTDHKVIRFCFAKKDDTLEKAAAQLARVGAPATF